MSASLFTQGTAMSGARVVAKGRTAGKPARMSTVITAGQKKVFSYDDAWTKGSFFQTGLFLEDKENRSNNVLERVQKKKILSGVEKSGLLSAAEKAGFSLSKVEKLGLLSKAEKFGALSLLEKAATTNPATTASLGLPCVVAAILSLTLIPGDGALVIVKDVLAAASLAGAVTFLAVGVIVADLNE